MKKNVSNNIVFFCGEKKHFFVARKKEKEEVDLIFEDFLLLKYLNLSKEKIRNKFWWKNVNTSDLIILHKKCPNRIDFPDVIFNFSKLSCGLP